jgi:hypothetical protein
MTDTSKPQRIPQNSNKAYELGFKNGKQQSVTELRQEIMEYLHVMYMDDNVERDSVEAKAILAITRKLSEKLK